MSATGSGPPDEELRKVDLSTYMYVLKVNVHAHCSNYIAIDISHMLSINIKISLLVSSYIKTKLMYNLT